MTALEMVADYVKARIKEIDSGIAKLEAKKEELYSLQRIIEQSVGDGN